MTGGVTALHSPLKGLRLKGAHTIPLAPFLVGRGKIIEGLEGHPPDLLPKGLRPSGLPPSAWGARERRGSRCRGRWTAGGRPTPDCCAALAMAGGVAALHSPLKGLRLKGAHTIPLAPFLKGRGKITEGLEGHPPDLLPKGCAPLDARWQRGDAGDSPDCFAALTMTWGAMAMTGRHPPDLLPKGLRPSGLPPSARGARERRGSRCRGRWTAGGRPTPDCCAALAMAGGAAAQHSPLKGLRLKWCAHHPPGPLPERKGEDN